MKVVRWLIDRYLRKKEAELGVSLAYLRHMAGTSIAHFLKFMCVMPLAQFRQALPAEVYHVARMVTARYEDCGSCLEAEVRLAKGARVSASILHSVLDENPCALPPELAEVYLFAEAVATSSGAEDEYRETLLRRFGDVGLVELSLAIAACRVVPTVKHVLGCTTPPSIACAQAGDQDR